jgi:Coenzyme PQQ synthesis protein D (PqqD)
MQVLDASSVFKRSVEQVSCNLDEEVAILDLEKSRYFGLAGVGAHIWAALEQPRSVGEICDSVVDHFDVTPEVCRDDVVKFLTNLQEVGLVQAVG